MLARGERFSYRDFVLRAALIDVDTTRMNRARSTSSLVEVEEDSSMIVRCDFDFPQSTNAAQEVKVPTWEVGNHLKEEEFTRAITLGLFDYLRKSRSHGFVVSLSGGADSAERWAR